jgi:hypothetical protein
MVTTRNQDVAMIGESDRLSKAGSKEPSRANQSVNNGVASPNEPKGLEVGFEKLDFRPPASQASADDHLVLNPDSDAHLCLLRNREVNQYRPPQSIIQRTAKI